MRRWIILLFALLLAMPHLARAQERAFVWQAIDTNIAVQKDGRLRVSETLTLRYSGGPFTFAYRDMPTDYLERISNIQVRDAERAYTLVEDDESTTPGTFSIDGEESGQRVRWVYAPTTNTTRTFVVEYEVAGAVTREGDQARLRWPLVFANRDEAVEQASGRVQLPGTADASQLSATIIDAYGNPQTRTGELAAQVQNIPPDEDVYLDARFPGTLVTNEQPAWYAAELNQVRYNATLRPVVDMGLALATLVLGAIFSLGLWRWQQAHRDPKPLLSTVGGVYTPPDQRQPALAARLLGNDGGIMQSTLFDLANRGFLRFAAKPGSKWSGPTITAMNTIQPTHDLAPFERDVLHALLNGQSQVELSKRQGALAHAATAVTKQLTEILVERGDLTRNGLARRSQGMTIGGIILTLGLVGLIPAFIFAARISGWLVALAAVFASIGLVWLIVASSVRGVSPQGAEAVARWQAFKQYLQTLQPAAAEPGAFGQLLPYAVALGTGIDKLTNAYQQTSEPLPAWYQPTIAVAAIATGAATGLLLRDWKRDWDGFNASFIAASGGGDGGGGGGGGGGSGGGGAG